MPDLKTTFFEPWLGPRLKYSCAFWPSSSSTLAEAEDAMLALTCARAGLEDGMTVLDLGAGLGPLTLWIAERYPACRVVAVTHSEAEAAFLCGRGATAVCADAQRYEPMARFDRVFAIELFEQLQDHEAMIARIASCLAPDGRWFLQALAGPTWPARRMVGTTTSFELNATARLDRWSIPREHGLRTIAAWRANMEAARDRLVADHGARRVERWERFLGDCTERFREVQVFHALFKSN